MPEDLQTAATVAAITQFSAALNQHDVPAVMALMTDDCVFDNTYPAPDGERFEGQAAVRAFWEAFFRSSPDAVFEAEETFVHADRAVVRWRFAWTNADGRPEHMRGVDVLRVRDGKVAEKLAYVKG
jgi:ketosteroid isomerase-like protein